MEDTTALSQSTNIAPKLIIEHATGQRVLVEDIAEIQEIVPFNIILPKNENLPLGLKLSTVSVFLPPDIIGDQFKDRHITVHLTFKNKGGTAGI